MFPEKLYVIRHAQSEGNEAGRRAAHGDLSCYDIPGFKERPGHDWRLTNQGIEQAQKAGAWLKRNLSQYSNPRVFVSPFLRAKETYLEMGLAGSYDVREEMRLMERSWGDLDCLSPQERTARFSKVMESRFLKPMYWKPPNGESLTEVCDRMSLFHGRLHRFHGKYPDRPVICITHGECMWAGRHLLMRSTIEQYDKLDRSEDPKDRCHNCQIWEYSRTNPKTGETSDSLAWFRSVCPWDLSLSTNKWQPIVRPTLSHEDIRRQVNAVPRLVL